MQVVFSGFISFNHYHIFHIFQNKLDPTPKLLVQVDIESGEAIRNKEGHCVQVKVGKYTKSLPHRLSSLLSTHPHFMFVALICLFK